MLLVCRILYQSTSLQFHSNLRHSPALLTKPTVACSSHISSRYCGDVDDCSSTPRWRNQHWRASMCKSRVTSSTKRCAKSNSCLLTTCVTFWTSPTLSIFHVCWKVSTRNLKAVKKMLVLNGVLNFLIASWFLSWVWHVFDQLPYPFLNWTILSSLAPGSREISLHYNTANGSRSVRFPSRAPSRSNFIDLFRPSMRIAEIIFQRYRRLLSQPCCSSSGNENSIHEVSAHFLHLSCSFSGFRSGVTKRFQLTMKGLRILVLLASNLQNYRW